MASSLSTLLPADITTVQTQEPVSLETLLAEERAVIAAAVPKRALEFAAGRWCAREALRRQGIGAVPLLPDENRAPLWPGGIVGSITHTDGFCAAAVGRRDSFAGIGIDAELEGRVDRALWPDLFTRGEIEELERRPEPRRASLATVMFSAKESFYKAQYSIGRGWLDFTAAEVKVEADQWHLRLLNPGDRLSCLRQPASGKFVIIDRRVLTAIAIRRSQLADE
jgi:4'-phosphopantetheinyl transferase EntD